MAEPVMQKFLGFPEGICGKCSHRVVLNTEDICTIDLQNVPIAPVSLSYVMSQLARKSCTMSCCAENLILDDDDIKLIVIILVVGI